jgi:hypothetical protein
VNYAYIASVPFLQTDYSDKKVNVQRNHFHYKINVRNSCDIDEGLSDLTSSILLDGKMGEGREIMLQWSPYFGWKQGVEYFLIEKMDQYGTWKIIDTVDGSMTEYRYKD